MDALKHARAVLQQPEPTHQSSTRCTWFQSRLQLQSPLSCCFSCISVLILFSHYRWAFRKILFSPVLCIYISLNLCFMQCITASDRIQLRANAKAILIYWIHWFFRSWVTLFSQPVRRDVFFKWWVMIMGNKMMLNIPHKDNTVMISWNFGLGLCFLVIICGDETAQMTHS